MDSGSKAGCAAAGAAGRAGGWRFMGRAAWLLAAYAPWGAAASAQLPCVADVVIPGTKPIEYTISVEPSPLLAGRKLVVHGHLASHGWSFVEPGAPFESSWKYGTRILLLEEGASPTFDFDSKKPCAGACVDVNELRAMGDHVPALSTLSGVHTTLRVTRCSADDLRFEVVEHARRHDPWMVGAYALVLALGGFVARLAWSRRAKAR